MEESIVAIVSALWQTTVKYIADLNALAKMNPILDITFNIYYALICSNTLVSRFFRKFYLFFAALVCGASGGNANISIN